MSQIYYYDAHKIEAGHKRTGILISAVIHALLLFIFFLRILDFSKEPEQEIGVEILLPSQIIIEEPPIATGGGSSPGPESEEAQQGGSKGSEAKPALEEMEKIIPQAEPQKTTPVPTNPAPKPIIVDPEPQVVKVDPPKVETHNPSTKPVPEVIKPPVETKPTNSGGGGAHGNTGNASTGDDDNPGTGGTGTGSGTGTGAGPANSGSGAGGGGGTGTGTGTGSGDGVGVDFDETGPLKRKPIWRPDLKDLARVNAQIVVFNMCINREGLVTYIKYNQKLSKTKDMKFILEAQKKMQQYKFQVDQKAPKKECGTYTFNAAGMVQRLN